MHTTTLRKVGGSTMLTVPPAVLEQLQLRSGQTVDLSVLDGKIVIEVRPKPKYTLSELLAQSDFSQNHLDEEWVAGGPAGKELL